MDYTTKLSNNTNPSFNMKDYLIAHESGTKDYHLYLSINGRKMSDFKFNEEGEAVAKVLKENPELTFEEACSIVDKVKKGGEE